YMFDGLMAISPIDETLSLSKTGCHVVPLLMVFHNRPEADPTYIMDGLLSTTATSSIRPPCTAGPMERNCRDLSIDSLRFCAYPVITEAAITIIVRSRDLFFINQIKPRKSKREFENCLKYAVRLADRYDVG